jgi:hypothetical protein
MYAVEDKLTRNQRGLIDPARIYCSSCSVPDVLPLSSVVDHRTQDRQGANDGATPMNELVLKLKEI